MKRAALTRDLLVVLVLTACCWFGAAVSAHVRLKNPLNGNYLKWNDPTDVTVVISSTGSEDISDGSHTPAIQNAIAAWNEVGGTNAHMREVISAAQRDRTDWESNDLHMILFDEDNSSGFFPEGSATVAVTPIWFYSSGRISDADVLFNGAGFEFTTSAEAGKFDVQDVATHELGHLLGLDHSGWAGASMYPYVDESVTLHRSLSLDEVGGLRHAYPSASFAKIKGSVVREQGGSPVKGAHVVVRSSDGRPARSILTNTSGAFTLYGLDPGDYSLYVDPLDQPVSASNLGGGWTIQTDFGSAHSGSVTVSAGETHDIGTLFVPPPSGTALGRNSDDYPLACEIGETTLILVRGTSLFPGTLLSSSDPSLVIGEPTWNGWSVTFQVTVPPGTETGHVDLEVWSSTGELSILPAALEITPVAPSVANVVPDVGTTIGGTDLLIQGAGFRPGARVVLGDTVYSDGESCTVVDDSTIQLTTLAGAVGPRDVVVIDPAGPEGRSVEGYSFADLPTVQSVFPDAGSLEGGTQVVLTGVEFAPGATVFINGVQQVGATWIDSTKIEFTTLSSRVLGVQLLEVVHPDGIRATNSFRFTHSEDPELIVCRPTSGTRRGGDVIMLRGRSFTPGMEVWFGVDPDTGSGGVLAAEVNWLDDTTLEVVTPAHAPGHVDLLVLSTDSGQADMLSDGFQYKAPPSSGGACFSVSPPPDAGHGPWVSFVIGLILIAMASQTVMGARLRPRSMA
jgi:hypothetical protein